MSQKLNKSFVTISRKKRKTSKTSQSGREPITNKPRLQNSLSLSSDVFILIQGYFCSSQLFIIISSIRWGSRVLLQFHANHLVTMERWCGVWKMWKLILKLFLGRIFRCNVFNVSHRFYRSGVISLKRGGLFYVDPACIGFGYSEILATTRDAMWKINWRFPLC